MKKTLMAPQNSVLAYSPPRSSSGSAPGMGSAEVNLDEVWTLNILKLLLNLMDCEPTDSYRLYWCKKVDFHVWKNSRVFISFNIFKEGHPSAMKLISNGPST